MRLVLVPVLGLLILAGCAGKSDDAPAAAGSQQAADGQPTVTDGPNGKVLNIGPNHYTMYPPAPPPAH